MPHQTTEYGLLSTKPIIKTSGSDNLKIGISSEDVIHHSRIFDSVLSRFTMFKSEVSKNTLDGINSQDYHVELFGGQAKHNAQALVRLKIPDRTSLTLYQVYGRVRVTDSLMTSDDYRGKCHCADGPFSPQIILTEDLLENKFEETLQSQLKMVCDELLALNNIKSKSKKVMREDFNNEVTTFKSDVVFP
jgi:hypothetical protein